VAKQRIRRAPTLTQHLGEVVSLVPLANSGQYAMVEPETLAELEALGVSLQWVLNETKGGRYRYVRAAPLKHSQIAAGRSLLSVAPIIISASRDEQVTYRDGNPLNLLRSNLVIEPRFGRRRKIGEQPIYVPKNDRSGETPSPALYAVAPGAGE